MTSLCLHSRSPIFCQILRTMFQVRIKSIPSSMLMEFYVKSSSVELLTYIFLQKMEDVDCYVKSSPVFFSLIQEQTLTSIQLFSFRFSVQFGNIQFHRGSTEVRFNSITLHFLREIVFGGFTFIYFCYFYGGVKVTTLFKFFQIGKI